MSQSNTASSASSAPEITTAEAASILSKSVPSADKKSALQKKQERFASSKTSVREKVLAMNEIGKQFGALTVDMIVEAITDSGEFALLPAPDGATTVRYATPYSKSYGYNAAKSEHALVALPAHGKEFVHGYVGRPGENKGKLSDMKSCFDLDWVNSLVPIAKHKVIRAMSIIWKTLEVLSETIFLEAAGYFPRYTAYMHSSEMTSFFKGMSNIEDCISTALTSQVWDCDKGSVFQNLYDIGLGPADCTCTNKLRYPAWAVPCTTAAEGSMRVGMRCRIRDTWAILPSATELANRLGAVKAGWVPEPPDETCTSGCTNGDEGVVIGRGLIHRGGHNAYGHNEFETAVAVQMASRCVRTSGGVSSAAKKPVVVLIDERSVQYIGRQLTGSVDLDSSECAICLEEHCRDTVVLDCTHSFCYVCLERHQSQTAGAVCPLCRDSMRDIAKDGVPEGVRWRAGDRVHARFPRESTVDGTDVAVIDPKSGIPFEVLATVTGLPEGSFEPAVLFITYV
eukprot:gene2125-19685_t